MKLGGQRAIVIGSTVNERCTVLHEIEPYTPDNPHYGQDTPTANLASEMSAKGPWYPLMYGATWSMLENDGWEKL